MQTPTIIQATGFKKYTPHTGNTIPFSFATMYLTQDCTMNVTDHYDNEENNVPFTAGYHPVFFKKIRSISAGSVYLCHNGVEPTLQQIINPS
jgi:hypothetical protein